MKRREFLRHAGLVLAALPLARTALSAPARANLARKPPKKTIVIGAGLAGLSAAYELTLAGHHVTVLEARTRPGGRVHTLRSAFADGLHAEAGATRIPNHHHHTLGYVKHFGLSLDAFQPALPVTYSVRGKRVDVGSMADVERLFELTAEERKLGVAGIRQKYVGAALAELGDVTDPRWPPAALEKYDRMSRYDFWRERGASPEAIALMTLGGFDDRAESISALFMLRNAALNRPASHQYKIRGGNDLLPAAFAARLSERIRYACPVVAIEHDDRGATAVFMHAGVRHTLTAERLICAVPFTVQRTIRVSPVFSSAKRDAIEQLPYHSLSKIFLQCRRRFWLDSGRSGFATTDLPIGNVWDMTHAQPGRRGILQAFPIGAHARRVTAMDEAARTAFALAQVEQLFPGTRDNFESGVSKCWDEDVWARGGTAFYRPGQIGALLPHVARPEGRIHFAGEHTSVWIDGWMQGALESGQRVAAEVNDAP